MDQADRTVAAFLAMSVISLGRLLFAMITGRALVGVWERADRRTEPVFFWGICAIDIAMIAACVAVILGWRPFDH